MSSISATHSICELLKNYLDVRQNTVIKQIKLKADGEKETEELEIKSETKNQLPKQIKQNQVEQTLKTNNENINTNIINNYIINLKNDIITGFYYDYNNSNPLLSKLKKIIENILIKKKINIPKISNFDIGNLFNNNKNNNKITEIHTNYIEQIFKIWNNKSTTLYTKIYNIYIIILGIEQFINKKLSTTKKGGFNKNKFIKKNKTQKYKTKIKIKTKTQRLYYYN